MGSAKNEYRKSKKNKEGGFGFKLANKVVRERGKNGTFKPQPDVKTGKSAHLVIDTAKANRAHCCTPLRDQLQMLSTKTKNPFADSAMRIERIPFDILTTAEENVLMVLDSVASTPLDTMEECNVLSESNEAGITITPEKHGVKGSLSATRPTPINLFRPIAGLGANPAYSATASNYVFTTLSRSLEWDPADVNIYDFDLHTRTAAVAVMQDLSQLSDLLSNMNTTPHAHAEDKHA